MSNLNNFNFTNFNKLVEQAKQAVMCDSNCQKEKKTQELKEKYLAAQQNLLSAGSQEVEAKKNYVVFTKGELAYHNERQDELHKQAQLIVNKFNDNFNTYLQQIKLQIDSYNGLIVNFKNVVELYLKYKEENVILTKKVKDNSSDVLTNDRKTYYENQGVDTLKSVYNYILLLIYIIFVIGYIFTAVFYQSQINWKIRFLILILLFILPFIAPWILGLTINLIYNIYELLPKNIHLTI
jgi:hypothetical protein